MADRAVRRRRVRRDRLHRRADRRVPRPATTPTRHTATRWALAGRNRAKLEQTRTPPGRRSTRPPPTSTLLEADAGDPDSLRRVAESHEGRDHHRRPLHPLRRAAGRRLRRGRHRLRRPVRRARVRRPDVAAPPRPRRPRPARGWSTRAASIRSRTTSACYTPCDRLPEGVPITVEGFVRTNGTFSGGTYHSTVEILGRLRQARRPPASAARSSRGRRAGSSRA